MLVISIIVIFLSLQAEKQGEFQIYKCLSKFILCDVVVLPTFDIWGLSQSHSP